MNNRRAVAWAAMLLVAPVLLSCNWNGQKSPQHKLGWRAEEYFGNAGTADLCHAISAHNLALVKQRTNKSTATDVGKNGMTPLLWALTEDYPEAVEMLLKAGADPHVFIEDDFGARKQGVFQGVAAIHVAAGKEDPVYLKLFLENGADANLVDRTLNTETPIFVVVNRIRKVERHIKILLEYGSNLEHKSWESTPTRHAAVKLGRFDVALELLKAGADPKATTLNGKTRLVHLLFRKPVISRSRTQEQETHYQALLKWLDEHGESIEQAKADVATGEY